MTSHRCPAARSRWSSPSPWPSGRCMSSSSRSTWRSALRNRTASAAERATPATSKPGTRPTYVAWASAARASSSTISTRTVTAYLPRPRGRDGTSPRTRAPPRGEVPIRISPPWRRATWPTRASPIPRPPRPCADALVVHPRSSTRRACSGSSPGPLSPTTTRSSPGACSRVTATRRSSRPVTASSALSTRLPSTVTSSRDGDVGVGRDLARDRQRRPALGRLRGLAQQQRGHHRVAAPRRRPGR